MRTRRDWWSAQGASKVATATVFAVAAAAVVSVVNWNERRNAVQDARVTAERIVARTEATREYIYSSLVPSVLRRSGPAITHDEYDPEWMSPVHVIREIDARYNAKAGEGLYFKRAAVGARNPKNEADEYEGAFFRAAARDPRLTESSGVRQLGGERWYVLMRRGAAFDASCIRCHDEASKAPRDVVRRYGADHGFGKHAGDLSSIVSVRVPLEPKFAAANTFSLRLSGMLLAILGLLFVATSCMNRRLLYEPLARVREHAARVARGERPDHGEIPPPRGRDLQEVTEAINAMATRLSADSEELERQVDARTREIVAWHERYAVLFEKNPAAMWVFDAETLAFLAVNEAAVQQYGWTRDEFLAMTIRDIRPAEDVAHLLAVHASSTPLRFDAGMARHVRKSGEILHVQVITHGIEYLGRVARIALAMDVTQQVRAEEARRVSEEIQGALREQIQQAQKMEAVGQLAGGVAHDFNNLLTVIKSTTGLLLDADDLPPQAREDVREIDHAAGRAAELTRKLLAFSRKQTLQPRVLHLDSILADAEKMLRRLVREDVELQTTLGAGTSCVLADPAQIGQVLMNLVVNASDAISGAGTIRIATADIDVREALSRATPGLSPGPHVVLTVADDGAGMAPEILAHVFEPFFTTKEKGRGTGLGLAIVYGIVKQSGGCVRIASAPGRGTTVTVYLPRAEARQEGSTSAPGAAPTHGGDETVLLVEDQEDLRRIARRALEARGYRVACAANGVEALKLAESLGRFDLLLTDVVMPEMGGRDLAGEITRLAPHARVLFMSGYATEALGEGGVLPPDVRFLQKPFTPDLLARAVRNALDGTDGPVHGEPVRPS